MIGARRRLNLAAPLLALTVWSTAAATPALAQQPPRPRIGYLASSSYVHPDFQNLLLFQLGSPPATLGGNHQVLLRSAGGPDDRLSSLATELVNVPVDIILAEGVAAAAAAKAATRTIPIVLAITGDPVQAGLVSSFARPGANVTGITSLSPELVAK